jgi:hypothetical protein
LFASLQHPKNHYKLVPSEPSRASWRYPHYLVSTPLLVLAHGVVPVVYSAAHLCSCFTIIHAPSCSTSAHMLQVPLNPTDDEQGPIVRYSRARTESGVPGDVNFLEHATASYPVPSGLHHHQTADTLCFLPRPEEDAAAAAAAAPGCEEVVIGGPWQPGSIRWELGVYQVSDSQVRRGLGWFTTHTQLEMQPGRPLACCCCTA